jgi:hypothetical protein
MRCLTGRVRDLPLCDFPVTHFGARNHRVVRRHPLRFSRGDRLNDGVVDEPETAEVPNLPSSIHHPERGAVPLQKTEEDGVVRSSEWICRTRQAVERAEPSQSQTVLTSDSRITSSEVMIASVSCARWLATIMPA